MDVLRQNIIRLHQSAVEQAKRKQSQWSDVYQTPGGDKGFERCLAQERDTHNWYAQALKAALEGVESDDQ